MFHCVDLIKKQPGIRQRSLRGKRRPLVRALLAALAMITTLAGSVDAPAQDLSKYGADSISVIGGSSTGSQSLANGVPATSVAIAAIQGARVDAAGNIYFIQANVVRMLYVSGPVPAILQHAVSDYATLPDASTQPTTAVGGQGNVYSLINVEGVGSGNCQDPTCGDGASATRASLPMPYGLALDSAGNLYVADLNTFSVRKMSAADGTISTVAGDPMHAMSNYNGDNQLATAAYLTAPTAITFDASDNLFIADVGSDLVRRVDALTQIITTVAGNAVNAANGGPPCSDTTCGEGGPATSALLGAVFGVGVNSAGDLYIVENGLSVVRKIAHDTGLLTTVAGQRGVFCADTACGGEGVEATLATLNAPQTVNVDGNGGLVIADTGDQAIRGVTSDGKIYTLAGTLSQTPQTSPTVFTGAANSVQFNEPEEGIIDAAGHLIVAEYNPYLWQVAAPSMLIAQMITFNQIPDTTYGATSFDLTQYAAADSQLALTFTCAGPATCTGTNGARLTITGAGSVTVTANQAGDATHAPATPATSTFTVAKAVLTVTADPLSFKYNSADPFPPLTYSFAGFANHESTTVVTGAPTLSTTATANSPVGFYPITVAPGSLAAANYTFTLKNGTFTISAGLPQTITFNALPNLTYGAATFTLPATASSGLPVSYTVSGPAQPPVSNNLTVTGVGPVTVTASQPGDETYGAATPVTRTFQVAPAVLNIVAQPATRAYNDVNPTFTYTATGFVSADTAAVLSGAPAFATTAVTTSAPGSYPLTISQGTLYALNYSFTFTNSTLTIGKAVQTITFPPTANATFGTNITLAATASSGLAVQYALTGQATIISGLLVPSKPGQVVVTATQPGNDVYQAAAPVSVTYNFQKMPLIVQANDFTIPSGAPLPTFTYTVGQGGFSPLANELSGVPDLETTATSASAPGVYPIVATAGGLISDYFNFQFINGTLTILQPSSFILTSTPASVTIPNGQARQVTITLTPVNSFVGSVSIGCSGLPTGVTCVASPSTLTTVLSANGVNPVTATLTISAGAQVATAQTRVQDNRPTLAGLAWLPAVFFGVLLTWHRRRLQHHPALRQLLLLTVMLLSLSGLIACGGSSKTNSVQPGTTTIQVTGSGTSTSGPTSASLALSVTIQ